VLIIIMARKLVKRVTGSNYSIIFLATLLIVILGTVGGYFAESPVNSSFQNLGDSLWWTVVTMSTVGYGDIVPKTVGGRIIGSICMFGGPLLVVSLVGSVGVSLYNRWTKGVKGMGQIKAKGHIVICGWNKKAKDIIDELKAGELRERPITIIDDKIDAKPVEDSNVSFIRGNASELHTLNRANIEGAGFAVILAEDNTPVADQKTVLTVLAIEKASPSIISCAELNDLNNEEHLRRAGCSIVINASIIVSRLLAMSLQNPAVNSIIKELVSQEGNEIYRISVPQRYVGQLFIDTLPEMKKSYGIIPIGIERDGQCLINPDASLPLKASDLILVLSEETPRL
jgi:voltage-gated potassium channel